MAKAEGDHVTIEFDDVAKEFKSITSSTNLNLSPRCSIFKVPNILKRHIPKAYEPNAFSIGPYHYGKEHLKATQKIKLMYLHELINRSQGTISVRTLIEAISEVQQEARECYAEPFDDGISMDLFVEILVLDGCFLIELFRKSEYKHLRKDDDPIFMMSCRSQFLSHDLILLENQIPWLVLELLFEITKDTEKPEKAELSMLALNYCDPPGFSNRSESCIKDLTNDGIKHILGLLWNAMVLPNRKIQHDESNKLLPMPPATRLRDAGVNLKENKSPKSILDIKFVDGDLEIPRLRIEDTTESLFRNLICLEQCLPKCRPTVTCYAKLLDDLINTNKDMEILCESEILDNWLNNNDAAKLFNRLGNDTRVTEYHYSAVIKDVNKFCQRYWPRNRAALKHNYFNNPWAAISVIAAAALLILTVAQTVFTIIK